MLIMPLLSVTRTLHAMCVCVFAHSVFIRSGIDEQKKKKEQKQNSHEDEHTVRPLLLSLHY